MAADTRLLKAKINIKVVGVGGGGNSVLLRLAEDTYFNAELIGINTDKKMLERLERVGIKTLAIGEQINPKGRGTGSNVELGMNAARIDEARIRQALEGADLVFVTAGMGAGTGTGASPVVAKIAADLGVLSIGVVTLPFSWEGNRKRLIAEHGIAQLNGNMDALIAVRNDNLLKLPEYKRMSFVEAFKAVDNVLREAIECISEVILTTGVVNVDFADVRTVLRQSKSSAVYWGIGIDEQGRAVEAVKKAITNPLIDQTMNGAHAVILNITGGDDLPLCEVSEASKYIYERTAPDDPDVNIIFGTVCDPKMGASVRATIIAADFESMRHLGRTEPPPEQTSNPNAGSSNPAAPAASEAANITGKFSLDVPIFMVGGQKAAAAAAKESLDAQNTTVQKPIGLGRMNIPRWPGSDDKK